ncbi:MAG: hypothetical protein CSA36_02345 [Draconibacterium sp.]|nr:MAG: hypothetical protein CSA36_02345 [Draconibacterium sp.]
MKIFPNPATHYLFFNTDGFNAKVSIMIFDVNGSCVKSEQKTLNGKSPCRCDVSMLKSGIYLLSVSDGNNLLTSRLVIF